ncbi:MAG: hypothetical protein ACLFUB_01880 [Cyclobacteriaceae bacterium]
MKKIMFTLGLLCLLTSMAVAQTSLQGAWLLKKDNGMAVNDREMTVIFSDNYFMFGNHYKDGRFISAGGGHYRVDDEQVELNFDFFTDESAIVRVPMTFKMDLKKNNMSLSGNVQGTAVDHEYERLKAKETPLSGAWRFATRVDENGVEGERREPGPRQTIKIIGGGRFQWAAFNYETKQFMGTGGGTYSAEEGKYTERIGFFSRDDSRVGNSLSFDFNRKGDDWYHKGKSSKGDPLHEVWTKVK